MRIVSFLPSATEILCELGLFDQLVGVTHECDYPPSVSSLTKVTNSHIPARATSLEIDQLVREKLNQTKSLYSLDSTVMERLQPDLIVTQTLCDVCAVERTEVERIAMSLSSRPKIVNLEPTRFVDLYACILQVANAVDEVVCRSPGCKSENRTQVANTYIAQLQQRVHAVTKRTEALEVRPRVALLEWIDPLFSSGHWNPELVEWAGGHEILGLAGGRSKTIRWEELVDLSPDAMVIACCGFSIDRTLEDLPKLTTHPAWKSLPCVEKKRVFVVDGSSYFNRPGPRLVDSLEMLASALHPEIHPLPPNLPAAVALEKLLG